MIATPEEQKWIDDLQKLVNRKPKSIWLFNNGTMHVMRFGNDGHVVMTKERAGYVDQNYVLTSIGKIRSEGGDW